MKILCVSDYIDPLIYSTGVKKNFPDIDLILCAGDLPMEYIDFIVSVFNKPTYFIFGNHDLKEFKYYHKARFSAVSTAQDAAASLSGVKSANMHTHEHNHGAVYAGFRVVNTSLKINHPARKKPTPLLIAGASGSRNYNGGLCQYTESQMKLNLLGMLPRLIYNKIRYGRFLDIFLTHATPLGFHDMPDPCHKGFESFNWFLKKFKPDLMVHGHIHLYDQRAERVGKLNDSVVVNAYAHHVIDYDPILQAEHLQTERKNEIYRKE